MGKWTCSVERTGHNSIQPIIMVMAMMMMVVAHDF